MADPAWIFHDKSDRPGTHVLLIGVGDYPWLLGGARCKTPAQAARAMGMGQLGAPTRSMRAMADWFLEPDGFVNPDKPLASLSMLLSEPQAAVYQGKTLPRGTMADVRKAVSNWLTRGGGRRDNALVFAFCGHGVQSGSQVLLCRDYAQDPQHRFGGAIDFKQFSIGLATRLADDQLLLIDACRTPDLETGLLGQAAPGDALISLDDLGLRDGAPTTPSVHFATSLYTEAWGRDDGPSLFTDALLTALSGGGANFNDDWWITTSRLHSALTTYLTRISKKEKINQRPAAETVEFRISKPAKIAMPLYVQSQDPAIWGEKFTVKALRDAGVLLSYAHDPKADATGEKCAFRLLNNPSLDASEVTYEISAQFGKTSDFTSLPKRIVAIPPEAKCDLNVRRR